MSKNILIVAVLFNISFSALANTEKVVKGSTHSCRITDSGRLQCKGKNHFGQLGNGNQWDQESFVDVQTDLQVSQVVIGESHTCFLPVGNKEVYCFGDNTSRQLGILDRLYSTTPVLAEVYKTVDGLDSNGSVVGLAVNSESTCIRVVPSNSNRILSEQNSAGMVVCWGSLPSKPPLFENTSPNGFEMLYSIAYGAGKTVEYAGLAVGLSGEALCCLGKVVGKLGEGISCVGNCVGQVSSEFCKMGQTLSKKGETLARSEDTVTRSKIINNLGNVAYGAGRGLGYMETGISGVGYCSSLLGCGTHTLGQGVAYVGDQVADTGKSGIAFIQKSKVRSTLERVENFLMAGVQKVLKAVKSCLGWMASRMPHSHPVSI